MFFILTASVLLMALACGRSTEAQDAAVNTKPAPTPSSVKEQSTEPITIAAVGDIMLGSTYPNESRMPPEDGAKLLEPVTSILSTADIAFGNLEGPMADSGVSTKCRPNSTRSSRGWTDHGLRLPVQEAQEAQGPLGPRRVGPRPPSLPAR